MASHRQLQWRCHPLWLQSLPQCLSWPSNSSSSQDIEETKVSDISSLAPYAPVPLSRPVSHTMRIKHRLYKFIFLLSQQENSSEVSRPMSWIFRTTTRRIWNTRQLTRSIVNLTIPLESLTCDIIFSKNQTLQCTIVHHREETPHSTCEFQIDQEHLLKGVAIWRTRPYSHRILILFVLEMITSERWTASNRAFYVAC